MYQQVAVPVVHATYGRLLHFRAGSLSQEVREEHQTKSISADKNICFCAVCNMPEPRIEVRACSTEGIEEDRVLAYFVAPKSAAEVYEYLGQTHYSGWLKKDDVIFTKSDSLRPGKYSYIKSQGMSVFCHIFRENSSVGG